MEKHHLFFHLRNVHVIAFGPSFQEAGVGAISSAQKAANALTPKWMLPPGRVCPGRICAGGLSQAGWARSQRLGGRAAQAKYAPQNQAWRAERPSAAWGGVLHKHNMPVEITLGALRSRSPLERARRPGGPCYMGVRLGLLGAHSLKLP